MYEQALKLRRNSYTLRQIADSIEREHSYRLSEATISSWTRGINAPNRAGHVFIPKPSPDLAYVIGVEAGDGFLNVKRKSYQYRIRLRAVDREFVEAFNQAVSKVLGCPPHRLWKGNENETEVEFGSYLLHKFLLQSPQQLSAFIEHDKECAAAFLRGFFDSEGCIDENGVVTASNTDLDLLKYVQSLFIRYFQISTTGPRIGSKKGSVLVRRGRKYFRNSDCYVIRLPKAHLATFSHHIGFTIRRKQLRLERVLTNRKSRC
jgi:intein-encoded DNA endonuclease-like protein